MNKQTEAERLADQLEDPVNAKLYLAPYIAAELRRLVSFNKDLMDEVARLLNKDLMDEVARLLNKDLMDEVARLQKREWVGLTDEDKQIAFDDTQEGGGFWDFADAIEAILKRKNK